MVGRTIWTATDMVVVFGGSKYSKNVYIGVTLYPDDQGKLEVGVDFLNRTCK